VASLYGVQGGSNGENASRQGRYSCKHELASSRMAVAAGVVPFAATLAIVFPFSPRASGHLPLHWRPWPQPDVRDRFLTIEWDMPTIWAIAPHEIRFRRSRREGDVQASPFISTV
jgi:hypothetical protein